MTDIIHSFLVFWALIAVWTLTGLICFPLFVRINLNAFLVAPCFGLLFTPVVAAVGYVVLGMQMSTSAIMAIGILSCAGTIMGISYRAELLRMIDWRIVCSMVFAILTFAATNGATLQSGDISFSYLYGTDHLGYAHLADYVRDRPVTSFEGTPDGHILEPRPRPDPAVPYDSWPSLTFRYDPRAGSYILLAVASNISRMSGMFTYPLLLATVLCLMTTALAALFTRSVLGFAGAWLLLSTTSLFELGQIGFLGKAIGYPSAILLAGIYCLWVVRTQDVLGLSILAIATGAAATMHSGVVTGAIIAFLTLPLVLSRCNGRENTIASLGAWVLLPCTALLATGILSRPLTLSYPHYLRFVDWMKALDLEGQSGVSLSHIPASLATITIASALTLTAALGAIAVAIRSWIAATFLLMPIVLFVAFAWRNETGIAQLSGLLYAISLCGSIALICDLVNKRAGTATRAVAVAALIALAGLHIPRFLGALDRYAFLRAPVEGVRFSRSEMELLKPMMGNNPVLINVGASTHHALPLLVEWGGGGRSLYFSPDSWRGILGYRPWPTPPVLDDVRLEVVLAGQPINEASPVIVQTRLFRADQGSQRKTVSR